MSFLLSQSADFRYNGYNENEILLKSGNISRLSSLWLTDQISIGREVSQQLIIKIGYSKFIKKINGINWTLPDLNLSLRISNYLFISVKIYGFHLSNDSPQIHGAGIHYLLGNNTIWMVSYQKNALNGLKDFRLVSSSLNVEYFYPFSKYELFFTLGSNTYKQSNYYFFENLPSRLDNEINFIGMKFLIPYESLKFGFFVKMNTDFFLSQISISKIFI